MSWNRCRNGDCKCFLCSILVSLWVTGYWVSPTGKVQEEKKKKKKEVYANVVGTR